MKRAPKLILGYIREQIKMNSTGRRFLSVLLCLVMVLGLFPTFALSALAADTAIAATGNVTLTNGGTYSLSVNRTGCSITVPNGVSAKITVTGNVTLNNQSSGGSPITVAAGGNLALVVNGTLTVRGQHGTGGQTTPNSGVATAGTGSQVNYAGGTGGSKAYAGIEVQSNGILELSGSGTVNAYGGNAGAGGNGAGRAGAGGGGYPGAGIGGGGAGGGGSAGWATETSNKSIVYGSGAGGGAGAGAGIGGNGGAGGAGGKAIYSRLTVGGDGQNAGSAGTIMLYDTVTVYAYGGAGGAGGYYGTNTATAGINGNGGSGNDGNGTNTAGGAGGYSGGGANGGGAAGGGYFSGGGDKYGNIVSGSIGGIGGENGHSEEVLSGSGGTAGAGGFVVYTSNNTVTAYNGNRYTDGRVFQASYSTPIYLQKGFINAQATSATPGLASPVLGIGSGAGRIETSNGACYKATYHDISTGPLTLTSASGDYFIIGATTTNNITVNAGYTGTIILDDVSINMQNQTGKSAIDVKSGASLTLELLGANKLNGGNGGNGGDGKRSSNSSDSTSIYPNTVTWGQNAAGGSGGSAAGAGIAVPTGATLNVVGSGQLSVYGGDAGDGGIGWYRAGGGGGGFPAAGIGGGGGAGGSGGGLCYTDNGFGYSGGGGSGGGAGAGIGGGGGAGTKGADSGVVNNDANPGVNGNPGVSAGSITINAKVYAYGGSGGNGGSGCTGGMYGGLAVGDKSYTAVGGTNGSGSTNTRYGCGGGSGGGGFSAGGSGNNHSMASGYLGVGYNTYVDGTSANTVVAPIGGYSASQYEYNLGGHGGSGGSGGSITIVNSDLVKAQNGSKITTNTSADQNWTAANATPIRTQSVQGYGAGAGTTETNGSVIFMGAPSAPTSVAAALAGDYGENVTLTWTPPTNTGGDGVVLSGYTVVSEAQGVNKTFKTEECSVSGGRVSVTLTELKHNTASDFVVYANNAKGASEASNRAEITTKGVPLAPQNVEASAPGNTSGVAQVWWTAPDTSYNTNAITGYKLTLIPTGKANVLTEELNDVLMSDDGEGMMPLPPDEEAKTVTVEISVPVMDGDRMTHTFTGLHYGTVYQVIVQAVNGAGVGASNSKVLVETPSVAGVPNVTAQVSKGEDGALKGVDLSWARPENAGGIPDITAYAVERVATDAKGDTDFEAGKGWTFTYTDGVWKTADGLELKVTTTDAGEAYAFLDDDETLQTKRYGYTYKYIVRGVNLAGNGLAGDAKATLEPAAPEITKVEQGVKSLSVTWTAPVNNNNLPILEYKIYRDGELVDTVTHNAGTNSYTYKDESLNNNEEHEYTVNAVNATGEGQASEPVGQTTFNVPGEVNTLTQSGTAKDKGMVWWTAPSTNGGVPINGYRVTWKQDGHQIGTVFIENKDLVQDEQSRYYYTIENLSQGETYDIEVAAVNDAGDGPMPNGAFKLTTWTTPGLPLNVKTEAIQDGTGNLAVSWDKPKTNGGTEILGYYIYYVREDGVGTEKSEQLMGADNTATQLKGLDIGVSYIIYVSAFNEVGEGDRATARGTAKTAPNAPSPLNAKAVWSDKVDLNWAEAENNGSPVDFYRVDVYAEGGVCLTTGEGEAGTDASGKRTITYKYGADGSKTLVITYGEAIQGSADSRNSLSATVTGLEPYTNYSFTVRAHNEVGLGGEAKATALTMSVPFAVGGAKLEPVNQSGKLQATWGAPANTGGSPVTGYVVELYEGEITELNEGVSAIGKQEFASDAELKAVFEGLTDGQSYTAVIYAKNAIGDGVRTFVSAAPRRPADAPSNTALKIENGTEITLSWSDPDVAGLGGSTLTNHVVSILDKNGNLIADSENPGESGISFGTIVDTDGVKSVKISGLTMGGEYSAAVRVVTAAGDGADCDAISFTMWKLAGLTRDFKALPTNFDGGVMVTWNYPASDGDWDGDPATNDPEQNHTGVTDYEIQYRVKDTEGWDGSTITWSNQAENVNDKGECCIALAGLENGTAYEVRIRSLNGAGWSPYSEPRVVTPRMVPTAPAIGEVRTGNGSAVISSIDLPDNNGGDLITGYKLYAVVARKNDDDTWIPAGTPQYKNTVYLPEGSDLLPIQGAIENARVTGLENGVDYIITARAINGACVGDNEGGGLASNEQYVRVGMPEAPTDLRVSLGRGNSIISRYNAAEGNGSTILYYHVYLDGVPYTMEMVNGELVDTGKAIEFQTLVSTAYGTLMGEELRVQVSAVNKVGESPLTEPVTVIVGSPTTPEISGLTMYSDKVSVEWTQAEGNGVVMQGYEVYLADLTEAGDGEKTFLVEKNQTDIPLSLDIIAEDNGTFNLIKGHSYQVQVAAKNYAGLSTRSQARTFTFGVPQAPTITDVDFGTSQLTVTFKAPEDNGGSALTSFMIYTNGHSEPNVKLWLGESLPENLQEEGGWALAQLVEGAQDTYSVVIEGLANGSTYNVQATAWNEYGESDRSDAFSGTPATIAGAPGSVRATVRSDTEAALTWTAPAYNGGSEVSGYKVTVFDTNGNTVSTEESGVSVAVSGASATVTGLTKGASYYFEVQAITKVEEPGAAGRSNTITTFKDPGAPIITGVSSYPQPTGSAYDLKVTWDAPKDNGGTPIIGYNVYNGSTRVNGSILIKSESYTITNLQYSRTYNITVEAVNAVGSAKSDTRSAKIGQLDMPQVINIYSSVDDETSGTVYFHWNPTEGAVDSYGIFDVKNLMSNLGMDDKYTDEELAKLTSAELSDILTQKRVQMFDAEIMVNGGMSDNAYIDMLTVGETYYFAIAAYGGTLGFGMPTKVYAVTIGAPSDPVLTSAQGGYESLTLSWTAPEELNGYTLKGYQLYVNGTAYGDILDAAEAGEGELTHTFKLAPLDSGAPVSVAISAVSEAGNKLYESLPSNVITASPWSKPSTPESLTFAPGNSAFTVTFEASRGNGLDVAGYKVYWDGKALPAAQVQRTDNGDGTITLSVTGVPNGYKDVSTTTGYPVYVAAYTEDGQGGVYESDPPVEIPTIATGIPAAPEIRSLLVSYEQNDGKNTITIGYVDKEYVTGETTRSYEILITKDSVGEATISTSDTTYEISSFNDTPLTLGESYRLSVRAVNDFGPGAYSKEVTATLGAPRAPLNVSAIPGNGTATVTWTAPASNAAPITMYKINVKGEDGSQQIIEIDKNELSGEIKNLTNGISYSVTVTAMNKYGSSVESALCVVKPGAEPGAPASASAVAINDTEARVTWEPPTDDGGLPVKYYIIKNTVTGDSTVITAGETCEAVIDGLERGKSYTFTVEAHNSVGGGPAVTTGAIVTHTLPGKPSWESISSSDGTIIAKWNPPESDGGSDILSYTMNISKFANDGVTLETVHTIEGIIPGEGDIDLTRGYITYIVPKDEYPLDIGTEYKVSISARNATIEEDGASSDNLSVTIVKGTVASAPGAPIGISTEAGNGEVTVIWNAPSYNGGIGIDGYYIYYKPVNGEAYDRVSATSVARSATIKSLTNGTAYEFYVTAYNTEGESAPSYSVTAAPTYIQAPGTPTNLRYTSNSANNGITFSWDASTGEGDITYNVYVNNNTGTPSSMTEDTYIILPAAIGVKYELRVEAVNKGGKSAAASIYAQCTLNVDADGDGTPDLNLDANYDGEQDETIVQTAPEAPVNVQASVNGASSITLTWQPPENLGGEGMTIQNYKVFVDGVSQEVSADTNSYTLEDISAGKIYTFQVSAVNAMGESRRSDALQVYVQASTAPSNLRYSFQSGGHTGISLEWDAPTAVNKTPSGYKLQINGLDQETLIKSTNTTLAADLEKTYVFRVYAVYGDGDTTETSKTSEPLIVSTEVPTPGEVTDLRAEVLKSETGERSIQISFTPVENATGYELYVNGALAESGFTSGGTYLPDTEGIYTIYVVAVNQEGEIKKSSGKSNLVSVNTKDKAVNEPDQVAGLTGELAADYSSVTLSWDAVTAPEGCAISYNVYAYTYADVNDETIPDTEIKADGGFYCVTDQGAITETSYEVITMEGTKYAFYVVAVATPDEEGSPVSGAPSNMVILTAAPELALPGAPTGVMGSYDRNEKTITLNWNPNPEMEEVTGYMVYGEVNGVIGPLTGENITGTTFTWTVPEDSTKTAYIFQIAAVNTTGEGTKSTPVTVSTAAAFQPEAPDPAVIKDYVFTQDLKERKAEIKVIWTAPAASGSESNQYISGYRFMLNGVEIAQTQENYSYNGETGEHSMILNCYDSDNPIIQGEVYEVSVLSVAQVPIPETEGETVEAVSGAQNDPFKIAFGVNEDTDGDGAPDKNLDEDKDGIVDEVVITVRLNGTVTAGGSKDSPLSFSLKRGSEVLSEDRYSVSVGDNGDAFTISLKVSAATTVPDNPATLSLLADTKASDTYTLEVAKAGCTSYTITDIPIDTATESVDLGEVVLYVGDVNSDGTINARDRAILNSNMGKTGSISIGDLNGDGVVNARDRALLNSNVGKTSIIIDWK